MKTEHRGHLNITTYVVSFLIVMAGHVIQADAQSTLLQNGSFEIGDPAQGWYGISNWTSSEQWGGTLVTTNNAYDGTNVMRMFAFGPSSHILDQRIAVTAGRLYEVDGRLRTPAGDQHFSPTNGYCTVLLQFYNSAGTKIGGNIEAERMKALGSTSWVRYTTGPALAPVGAVTARVSCLYYAGSDQTTNGWVEYDLVRAYTTTPTQAGALLNPDFEVQAVSAAMTSVVYWTAFGTAGAVVTNYCRNGRFAFQLWWTENLLGQSWSATAGKKYATTAFMFSPSSGKFASSTNAHGVILLQFLDASSNVLQTYESAWFTTNSPADTWVFAKAEGFAPVGTVYGRSMAAILGPDAGFGGSIYFDDFNQYEVPTTGTVAGLLNNPGFDDGPPGDAYVLGTNLPNWVWLGGSNAGFVVDTVSHSNGQSLAMVWPNNLAAQSFKAQTGLTYIVEGYVMTPSGNKMTSETAYATVILEFYNSVGGTDAVSAVSAVPLTKGSAADTWIKVSVTNRAPWVGSWVTGRVYCALLDPGNGAGYGGMVYFDSLRVDVVTQAVGNSQSGALWNPGFEYTAEGTKLAYVDNWVGLGTAGLVDGAYKRSGSKALKIYAPETLAAQSWSATAGWTYMSGGYAYTPNGAERFASATNTHGVVLLQYLNATGGVLATYESAWFTTGSAAGVWTYLAVTGKAPLGTVSGRTLVAILGLATGYSGAIWFDDLTQGLVSTGGVTQSGLLYNGGFDDGFTGDAYYLSNNLPNWVWLGGSNAGFVVDTVSHSNGQSLAMVWPNNLAAQSFKAQTGLTYIVEGYVMTPSGNKMTSETAYATVILEFYNSVGGTDAVSAVSAVPLTKGSAADTWIKVSVTNRAPWVGSWVTGRVYCALLDPANGAGYGGMVYFDSLRVDVVTQAVGNSQSGALWNPGFEYTAEGTKLAYVDNWKAFGNAGTVASAYKRSGARGLQIYWQNNWIAQDWPAVAGYRYKTEGYVYTPSANKLNAPTNAANVKAVVALVFLDTNGAVIGSGYVSTGLTSSSAANTWILQSAEGWAPMGAVTGRTLVGITGTDDAFSGEVWFDDLTQSLVSTGQTTQSGLLRNPSFEDGPTGNAYDLHALGWLPAWKWAGGNNAGFIGSDYAHQGQQALVLTYPQNVIYQDFTVSSVGQTGNLLQNPGFEIGPAGGATPDGWFKGGALGQENWGYETGTNGVVFYSWTQGNWGFLGQDVTVSATNGSVFTFSIRGLAEPNYSSSANETWLKMEFWVSGESTARYSVTENIYTQLVSNPNTWNTYIVSYTNSDNAINLVKVLFGYGNATDTGGSQAAKWDNASLIQSIDLSQSKTYVASGYLMTPSSAKFNTDGSSWGELQLTFYVGGSSNPATEFTAHSAKFGADRPANTWIYFSVTGQAPAEAVVTGRLSCLIYSDDPQGDFDLAGVIWFDNLHLECVGSQTGVTAYSQWQLQHFGSTTAPGTAPNEDYDGDGYLNWSEFVAGTQPTNAGSLLAVQPPATQGTNIVVRWPSVAGRVYRLERSTNLVAGVFEPIVSNMGATPPMNVYTDTTATVGSRYYYKIAVTNAP